MIESLSDVVEETYTEEMVIALHSVSALGHETVIMVKMWHDTLISYNNKVKFTWNEAWYNYRGLPMFFSRLHTVRTASVNVQALLTINDIREREWLSNIGNIVDYIVKEDQLDDIADIA